jgi:hypothetical protein
MKISYAASLAVFLSAFASADPIMRHEPDAAPAALAGAKPVPVEWENCGGEEDWFQFKNITINPNPPVP